jgi:zinc protease
MIKFKKFSLDNGLRVLVHEDRSTPLVAMNILYDVGSRDEDPGATGLAHLFEHLMFGGTVNIPDFDTHLQLAGGENNAFTNSDITSYYLTLPSQNIETGLWLESDRMSGIDFSQKNLDTQKKVVIEEYQQRYLNQPYGDAMLLLKPLTYKVHPYRWPTIGSDISHIMNTDIDTIKQFFYAHYAPNNAILSLTGNINIEHAYKLVHKWFDPIEKRETIVRHLPSEPARNEGNTLNVERDVATSALYKAWHICPRDSSDFYTLDLITDLLAGGESGRLFNKLVRGKRLFSELNAYLTSDIDPGLAIIHGKLMKDVDINMAEEEVDKVILSLLELPPKVDEMAKVKNKFEAANIYGNTSILNKALNLSYFELLGKPYLINEETELYRSIDKQSVNDTVIKYFRKANSSTLYYNSSRSDL